MSKQPCKIYIFLHVVRGNWRNAIFIECESCHCGRTERCPGFLLAFDADGCPIIISAEDVREMCGQEIDKAECLTVLRRESFESLFSLWLMWWLEAADECALLRLAGETDGRD